MRAIALLFLVALAGCVAPGSVSGPETSAAPRTLPLDAPVFSGIETSGQQDIWRLEHPASGTLRLKALPDGSGTPLKGIRLSVFSTGGQELASRSGAPGVALILPDLPAGVYRVVIQGAKGATGGYLLTVQGLSEIRTTPIRS